MGRVKTTVVKRLAEALLQQFPGKFSDDFDVNKDLVCKFTDIQSKKVKSQVAGYITALVRRQKA